MGLKYLIGFILFIGLWVKPGIVLSCHQSKALTCCKDKSVQRDKEEDCCEKFHAKKKTQCKHHKQCGDCNCHCASTPSILATSVFPIQLPKISFSIFKKLYTGLLSVYLSEGYSYPWVPPKIS